MGFAILGSIAFFLLPPPPYSMDFAIFSIAAATLTTLLVRRRAALATSPDSRIRVGILGTAFIAGKNRRAITASGAARVAAIASRDLPRAQAWARDAQASGDVPGPLITAYGSYEELIADPCIDAVYIPLPCGLHLPWVCAAAAAGKAVLCEKPVATSVGELEAMLSACEGAGVAFLDGTMFHHHTRLGAMSAELARPAFGPVVRVSAAFTFSGDAAFFENNIRTLPALEPLGCLGDVGQYAINFGLWAFQWELPLTVRAVAHQRNSAGVPLDASLAFSWSAAAGGGPRTLLADCGFTTAFRQWAEVASSNSVLRLEDFVISRTHEECSFRVVHGPNLNGTHSRVVGEETSHSVVGCNQESEMWKSFAGAVKARAFVPAWAAKTLAVQACLDAAFTSMERGGLEVAVARPTGLARLRGAGAA